MVTVTRGQAQDLLTKFAAENPKYREALIRDPKGVLEKQFDSKIPRGVTVKAIVETPDTLYVIVPHLPVEGELNDLDLEKVAGGIGIVAVGKAECSGGMMNTVNQISLV